MKHFNTEQKLFATIIICTFAISVFAACSLSSPPSSVKEENDPSVTIDKTTLTEAFSEKDVEVIYNDSEAETLTLNGNSAVSSSSSVKIDGSIITIRSKGTYVISGTLDDGYIVVNAGDTDDVRLVFKDASITSSDYAALYCLNADNIYITLEEGTQNRLISSGEFDSKDNNNVDGAIFAKTDITINGSGSLEIRSTDHGIVGKDDVTITGGSITITSSGDGIQANDSVAIQNAVIGITCLRTVITRYCTICNCRVCCIIITCMT